VDELENYKFKSVLAYGIFETNDAAKNALKEIKKDENKEYKIVSLKNIKNLYKNYIDGYDELKPKELVETRTIKLIPKPPQEYFTNEIFKEKFINAKEEYYTINLGTLSKLDDVVRLMDSENLYDNSFIFRFGRNKEWIKIVYGIYENYDDAKIALASLSPDIINKYFPVIESIKTKQDLFEKYKDLKLGTPTFSNKKGEFVKMSEDIKTELRDAKTKAPIKKKIEEVKPTVEEMQIKEKVDVKQEAIEKMEEEIKTSVNEDIKTPSLEEKVEKTKAIIEEKKTPVIEEKIEKRKTAVDEDMKTSLLEEGKNESKVLPKEENKVEIQELKTNNYIVSIAKIKRNRLDFFINRYQLDKYETRNLENDKVEIFLGMFDNEDKALEVLGKYHPYIQSIAKIEKE